MTFHQVNNLCKVTAFLHINDVFIGCAVIFKNNNVIMLATAFHVISSTVDEFSNRICSIKVFDEGNREFVITGYRGALEECHKRDIALLTLHGDDSDLQEVFFLDPLVDPSLLLISRCKNKKMNNAQALYSKESVEKVDGFFYLINVDKFILQDEDGNLGAAALEGISGAGVFVKINQRLVITGVISSIPDSGLLGKIRCCNSSCFLEIENSLLSYSHNDDYYNYGLDVVKSEIKRIDFECVNSVVSEWESDIENREFKENINRKMKELHQESKVDNEKRKIIRNLLDGNVFIKKNIKNIPEIMRKYSFAHSVFCGEDMTLYVSSRAEAKNKYDVIRESYLNALNSALKPLGLDESEIRLVRNRDIAFWLAICDLDFLGDNDD